MYNAASMPALISELVLHVLLSPLLTVFSTRHRPYRTLDASTQQGGPRKPPRGPVYPPAPPMYPPRGPIKPPPGKKPPPGSQ
ncbi:hypothetical protein NC652_038428 [Populus alba x Populus x berolinensis]|nr:hypothetical protein NC652_038428 [Populus alba x Populus x berolinensis]